MDIIAQKRKIVSYWSPKSTSVRDPALTDYIESTKFGIFGGFKVKTDDHGRLRSKSRQYIERLMYELDRKFKPSAVQESLQHYLIHNIY